MTGISETQDLSQIAKNSKQASYKLASLNKEVKNKALFAIADNIEKNKELILKENQKDLANAEKMIEDGKLTRALYNRLKLDDEKIKVMVQGIKDVANLEDPVNKVEWAIELDKDLELYRVSCPLGVIGVIFESRPDVVPQIAALAVKSSNAVILKGGSEADKSNEILINIINKALGKIEEFPKNSITLIKTRHEVQKMLELDKYIDLIIPRGSNDLVKYIQSNTKIPVLGHADGICHVYIDKDADFDKATKITIDSKIQYPSACNAVETLLIHKDIPANYIKKLIDEFKKADVIVKGDEHILSIVEDIEKVTEEDWKTEYTDKIISIKTVNDINEAIDHVNNYGSGHTDCIVTENKKNADLFLSLVDSAGTYHNASTRFADGFRYGLGAEVGISTNKTHARGPVGLEGLVIYKYKLYGNGQTSDDFSGENAKKYTHRIIS